jgi:hypothetical protein
MGELLETDFAVAEKDVPYRSLGRLLAHKQDLFVYLRQRWQDLFSRRAPCLPGSLAEE